MNLFPIVSLGLVAVASANIIFNHVPLACNQSSMKVRKGCLRGQFCNEDNLCEASEQITYPLSFRSVPRELVPRAFSLDGTCGAANGGTVCDPASTVYTGACCSQAGWCGTGDAHCGSGCQSGCSTNTTSIAPRDDGLCGAAYGGATCDPAGPYGGCCSQYGYCGSTPDHCLASNGCQSECTNASTAVAPASSQEPVIAPVTRTAAAAQATATTTDGTCGSSNGGEVCGNWPAGNCCSMYGFCGNTSSHCGEGCQSGDCISAPTVPAPGPSPAPAAPMQGEFNIVGRSGVPAMHAALMPNGRVFFLDKLENYTELKLSDGYFAMSSEYNPEDNTVVPLAYSTNAFCSGGAFLADGRVISVGGNAPLSWLDPTIGDGFNAIRYLQRSSSDASLNGQSWSEPGNKLASDRWYATAQTMPDGTVFVASGSLNGLDPTVMANNNPTYEILSSDAITQGVNVPFPILEKNQPIYMYPFIHLLSDGTLFVFVSKSSERFNVGSNTTVQTYPDLPGDYRTYPNTGGSVMLPLNSANNWNGNIIICGGGAYQDITSPTDPSCGTISPFSPNANWQMESMPEGRGMVEGTLLLDGTIVWLNGGNRGAQGFGLMADPTLEALLYDPAKPLGQRFTTLASSTIPRLYHSVSTLLLDGSLMVAGSNPVQMPVLEPDAGDPYVTEFRVEIYTPPYLQGDNANKRPTDMVLSTLSLVANSSEFNVTFTVPSGTNGCNVVLHHGGFVTHSVHMGHRMLQLDNTGFITGATQQSLKVITPPNNNVAPPGPYVVHAVCDGIPCVGQFVMVS